MAFGSPENSSNMKFLPRVTFRGMFLGPPGSGSADLVVSDSETLVRNFMQIRKIRIRFSNLLIDSVFHVVKLKCFSVPGRVPG